MTLAEFEKGLSKLKETFGDQYYPPTRERVLFSSMGRLDGALFLKAVDSLICNSKFPPMGKEIALAMAECREKVWHEDKTRFDREFEKSIFSHSDVSELIKCATAAISGNAEKKQELKDRLEIWQNACKYAGKV